MCLTHTRALRTVGEPDSLILISVTEGEYPLITDSDLVDDMFTDEYIHNTIERRRVHLFGFHEEFFELTECDRLPSHEPLQNMTTMDSGKHILKLHVHSIEFAYFCKCK